MNLSRRTVLRGLGAALALPWLEALAPAARRDDVPRRLVYVYVPNGVHMPDWTPTEEGEGFALPWILEPLAPYRDAFSILSGLTHDKARANGDGPGDHARASAVFLTGVQPVKSAGENIRAGVSADQLAAQYVGSETRFRSLAIGCEPGRQSGQCESGYSCVYSSNISWSSPTTPTGKEVNPRLVFDRLFRDATMQGTPEERAARLARRKSILDLVREDSKRLEEKLGANDRRKLDEYFTGLREIERRIERAMAAGQKMAPADARPKGTPEDYKEHVRLLFDMLVLAFQTDATRIATCMLGNEGTNRSYSFLDVPQGHHALSHHGKEEAKLERIKAINRWHVSQLAYLLGRLKSVQEGTGTLLDATMLVYGSGISDGDRHNHEDLPILLAGRGGGLPANRHLVYPAETPMNDLHLTLLQRMGVAVDAFGDSTGPLALG